MLRYILVEQTLFGPGDERHEAERDLGWWLEGLAQRNGDYLKQHPDTPKLYKSHVRYQRPAQFEGECDEYRVLRGAIPSKSLKDPYVKNTLKKVQEVFGGEHFCDIGVILERGSIDCDGLACFRVAELRQAGIHARPYLTKRLRWDGGATYHALVLWPDNTTEDPSLLLGMGGEDRIADRNEEIRKNTERSDPAYLKKILAIKLNAGAGGNGAAPGSVDAALAALTDVLGESVGAYPGALWPSGNVVLPSINVYPMDGGIPLMSLINDPEFFPEEIDPRYDPDRTWDESFDDALLRRTRGSRGGSSR